MMWLIKLLRHLLFLRIVSARITPSRPPPPPPPNLMEHLPASDLQLVDLALTVCDSLVPPDFTYQSLAQCNETFLNPGTRDPPSRSPYRVLCRIQESVRFEMPSIDFWQLAVLVPAEPNANEILNYNLIKPNTSFSYVSTNFNNKSYILLSTVINKDGRLSLWRKEANIPPKKPVDPKEYNIKTQFVYHNESNLEYVTGIFSWNYTGDTDVCFDLYNSCENSKVETKIWPNTTAEYKIEKMHLRAECTIEIKGLHGTTKLKYHTPSSVENISKSDTEEKDVDIPQDVSIVAQEEGSGWSVRVRWASPRPTRSPDKYNITLRTPNKILTLVLNGKAREAIFHNVFGDGMYNVSVYAKKGNHTAHTVRRAIFPGRSQWRWISAVGGAWCAFGLGIVAMVLCWIRLRQRIYTAKKPQNSEMKPLDDNCLEPLGAETWSEDGWEIKAERLVLHEVIGEGAFGVVRRGSLAPTGKEVAVKMLKDFPSLDEVRSFRLEMELMKSVGAHPHVVSLVGCCSGKRPLIIAEYCSRGDLLSFLRCSWDVMISKRHAKYYNNNIDASEYRNDLFKCKAQREHSKLVVNKLYDLQGICDSELTSLDLLSFCRQIAMGMEFLASNRLVHRDLAARNILVTGDRTLKIADFGLSRDVYEENQYKQKGNGKMPVKWMALESLTRRIYTTQSDVWSFGVVVWEVATVGGAPYAGVPAARLPRLLRAGYRMPRPANCSKQLYDLMLSCWRAQPRARPTFAALHARLDDLLNSACADDYLSLELDDNEAPPTPKAQRYFKILLRAKRSWTRGENYERPLKAPHSNHYTSSPMTLTRTAI